MDGDTAYIGMRQGWGGEYPFGLSPAERAQHTYVIGKTGTGKSTLLRNLIAQDIASGRGVGLIDPHGDLAQELLDCIPSHRADDLVYFNPADQDHPVGLNLLKASSPDDRHLVASGIISALKSIWHDSWGPRLEYVLYAAVASLAECQNVSLLGVQRMLIDPPYRAWVLRQVTDPLLVNYWEDEFARYDRRLMAEIISPIQNKVGRLLLASVIRNVLGQVSSRIDFRFMMDRRRIFIANLAKGKLGDDKANFLGAILITQFRLASMSRADVAEHDRTPFGLYVDEFHNFTTDSFASILAEARKYGLHLTLSHQHMAQLPPDICAAVLGNVGTTIAFRTAEADAAKLAREFGNDYTAEHFTDLENHEVRLKRQGGGGSPEPIRLRTLPPLSVRGDRRDKLVWRSREKYATRRSRVEDRIARWLA